MSIKNFRTTLAIALVVGLVAVGPLGMLATADGVGATGYVYTSTRGDPVQGSYGVATDVAATEDSASRQLIGGRGASFAYQYFRQALPNFNSANDDEAGYGSCGSSCGKRGILNTATPTEGFFNCADANRWSPVNDCETKPEAEARWTLYGATDAPANANDYARAAALGGELLHFPLAVGTVTTAFNVASCQAGQLKLTGALVSRMYRGNEPDGIRKWNHADLVALNPCLAGEDTTIVPVIRCDGSGTTFAYSDFLLRSSGVVAWGPSEVISSVAQNELCGPQNPGVAAQIKSNYGAFGYVELAQTRVDSLKQAAVQNRDGSFLIASEETGAAAASGAAPTLPASHGDWSQVSIAYAPGSQAYPASTFTYAWAYANPWDVKDPATGQLYRDLYTPEQYAVLKELLTYLSTEGQLAQNLPDGYAPIGAAAQINLAGVERMHYGPRVTYSLGNDGRDAVSLAGYPAVGQTVVAQPDGAFTFASLADGAFRASDAGAFVGINEGEGSYVRVSGDIQLVGSTVLIDGVPAGRLATGALGLAGVAFGTAAYGQVVDGSFLVHAVE